MKTSIYNSRAVRVEPPSRKYASQEAWKQQAKSEGIDDAIIAKVESAKLKYPIFFARLLKRDEINAEQLAEEANHWITEFDIYKQNFGGATPDNMHTLEELSKKLTEIYESINTAKKGKTWFDNPCGMRKVSTVRTQKHTYETYIYDDWETQRKVFPNPRHLCVAEMTGSGGDWNRQMFAHYGGTFNLIVKDGVQWALMAPRVESGSGFMTVSNNSLSPCERAIAILVCWDHAGLWQRQIQKLMNECGEGDAKTNEDYRVELGALIAGLPSQTAKELKQIQRLAGRGPDRILQLIIKRDRGEKLDEDDQSLLDEFLALIAKGEFVWQQALLPFIEMARRYERVPDNYTEQQAKDLFKMRADETMRAIRMAVDMTWKLGSQKIKRIKHIEKRDPTSNEKIEAYSPFMDVKNYLIRVQDKVMDAARWCSFKDYKDTAELLHRAEVTPLSDILQKAMPLKAASTVGRVNTEEANIIKSGNHHAIRYYYNNNIRGLNNAYTARPGYGKNWSALEVFLVDEIMSKGPSMDIKLTLQDYLGKVEDPQGRVEIMRGLAVKDPERAEATLRAFNSLLPIRLRNTAPQ
jgi:hypothetical protein